MTPGLRLRELDAGRMVDASALRRRALAVLLPVGALVGLVLLAPGVDDIRRHLRHADVGWLLLAVALEALSCLSYVAMFAPLFCRGLSRRMTVELALSELAVGALLPAGGAGGLALGAWALRRTGMPAREVATRTTAFFAIKSAPNFGAVAVVGTALGLGLVGPHLPSALTWLPAGLAASAIVATVAVSAVGAGPRRRLRAVAALGEGLREAGSVLGHADLCVIVGSIGYWAFDNAMLWVCFQATGSAPPVTVVLMGYLLGQLGGLLPLPGGVGGVEGGLVGALVVYGAPFADAATAVLAYRVVVLAVPLLMGLPALTQLQRSLRRDAVGERRRNAA